MPAFTVIDHTEIGSGGAASWTKSSIPSTYDHLMLNISARSTKATYVGNMKMQFNADSGTNYSQTRLNASTATPNSSRGTSKTSIYWGLILTGANVTANTFGSVNVWIPNYANTSNYKQVMIDGTVENNSTTNNLWTLQLCAALWQSTSALNQITIADLDSTDFVQYSTFTLYGVTGA